MKRNDALLYLREISKRLSSRVPLRLVEAIADYSVLREHPDLLPAETVVGKKKRTYYEAVARKLSCPDVKLTFLEFGVHMGTSIKNWATLNTNPQSRFVGFDSFEGLPVQWRGRPAGHLSANGHIPATDDSRVTFVKGWFNRTVEATLDELRPGESGDTVLAHIDSDLHSSALFCLTALSARLSRYHVMFDEFGAGEARALRDHIYAHGGTFTPYLGLRRASYSTFPHCVFGLFDSEAAS